MTIINKTIYIACLLLFATCSLHAQCTGVVQYPVQTVTANQNNDIITISTDHRPGQFAVIDGLEVGSSYTFYSDLPRYITIADLSDNVLVHGETSVTYTAGVSTVKMSVNFISPPCGQSSDPANAYSIFVVCLDCEANNVTVGDDATSSNSALLNVNSTTQGVLLPRMTSAQKGGIVNPANGLTVFDTTCDCISFYSAPSGAWEELSVAAEPEEKTIIIPSHSFTFFETIPGDSMTLYSQNTSFFGKYGAFAPTDVGSAFSAGVSLPVGSTITSITYYYHDSSPSNIFTARLTSFDVTNQSIATYAQFTSQGSFSASVREETLSNLNVTIEGSKLYYFKYYGNSESSPNYSGIGFHAVKVTYL